MALKRVIFQNLEKLKNYHVPRILRSKKQIPRSKGVLCSSFTDRHESENRVSGFCFQIFLQPIIKERSNCCFQTTGYLFTQECDIVGSIRQVEVTIDRKALYRIPGVHKGDKTWDFSSNLADIRREQSAIKKWTHNEPSLTLIMPSRQQIIDLYVGHSVKTKVLLSRYKSQIMFITGFPLIQSFLHGDKA